MKAHLQPDGSLALASNEEVRIVRASHPRYADLMRLFQRHVNVSLSVRHAPPGYTHDHPLHIAGHQYVSGQFIPNEVLADATPAEASRLLQPGPAAKGGAGNAAPNASQPAHEERGYTTPEGYGGHPWMDGTPEAGKVYQIPTEHLHVDPERFQFKQNVDRSGVTDEFKEVGTWDPAAAGTLLVWKDKANGKTFVVNGHHRRELAGRMKVPTMNAMYIEAPDAKAARAIGAQVNIMEGRGTAMDAAKFMRDTGMNEKDMKKRGISLKGKVAADAVILTKLNDGLFKAVAQGRMEQDKAIAIATHLADHNLQDQLAKFLAKKEDAGKEYHPKIIEDMAKEMAATPTHTTSEHTLFGDIESEDSLFGERNELKAAVRADLSKAVNDFKAVASERRAEVVGEHGNKLDVAQNKKIAEENAQALAIFDKLVNSKGVISDALNEGAAEYAKATGKKAKDAVRAKTAARVRTAVEQESRGPAQRKGEGSRVQGSPAADATDAGKAGAGDAGRNQTQSDGLKSADPLPEGWSIKPAGDALGLFREGRDTPVAKAKTPEELTSKIAIPKAKASAVSAEDAPKSKNHVAFVGKHEYYRGDDGRVYKATLGSKINPKTGKRAGTLSSEAELGKHQAKEAVKGGPDSPAATKNLAPEAAIKDSPDEVKPIAAAAREIKSITGKFHTTATERKAIAAGIAAGHKKWKSGRKLYELLSDDGSSAVVRVHEKESDDRGGTKETSQDHVVEFKEPAPASAGPSPRTAHTAPPADQPTENGREEEQEEKEAQAPTESTGDRAGDRPAIDEGAAQARAVDAPTTAESATAEEHGDAAAKAGDVKKPAAWDQEKLKADVAVLQQHLSDAHGPIGKHVKEYKAAKSKAARLKAIKALTEVLGMDGQAMTVEAALQNIADGKSADKKPTTEADHDDKLAGEGEGSRGAGLPAGEQLGGDAGPAPQPLLPGSGQGAGEGSASVPPRDDVRGDAVLRKAGGSGDAKPDSRGTGAATVAPNAAGRAGQADSDGDRGQPERPGASSAASPAERSLHQEAAPDNPTDLAAGNYRYAEDLDFEGVGLRTKFKQNIDAIKTLRAIELEGRTAATPAEQAVLAKYVGWGAFSAIFREPGEDGFDHREFREWYKDGQALRALLSADEWKAARGSTINAHYTNPDIVKLHWEIAQRLGFTGKPGSNRFLETSAGIGYYLGMMPPDMASRTHSSAVELDQVTGKMLKLLYPSANVNVQGFEEHVAPDNFYDLVASNVPFGDYQVHDPRYNKHGANIHDYFFLKSIDKVRPGGLVMHITSTGTMDKADQSIREEIAKQCDLVSAFRMPDTTHKGNAGTEVVTDMIILRKRAPGEKPSGPNWMETTQVACPRSTSNPNGGEPITVNRYFAEHPEQIIGELNRTGKLYGGDQKNVTVTDDADERLAAIIERLPKNIMSKPAKSKAFEPESLPAPGDVRPGGFTIKNGKLYRSEEGRLVQQEVKPNNLERVQGHMAIRDATREVINAQTSGQDATKARAKLNEVYDAFVAKHGFLNSQANKRAFRGDPDGPLLLALENWNNEAKTAAKSDMFSKDTIRRVATISHAENIGDALAASLHEHGHIDLDYMSKITGKSVDAAKKELISAGVAFEDPSDGFQPADQYLSGNVRRKLVLARAAAASDPKYKVNVDALEKVQPEDVDHTDITARLGASWIPGKDVAEFAAHLLSASPSDFDIKYVPAAGEWVAHYTNDGARRIKNGQAANSVWGVELEHEGSSKRQVADFMDILRSALSGRSITIKKTVGDGDHAQEVVDMEATEACRAKVQELKDAFCGQNGDGWLWEDDARRERLHRFYNDNFNNIRHMEYNGSHLKFPGMNPAIKLHPHIPNFVWQVVTTGGGLAAHEMGTGKTFTMIASAMELRRLGLAKKPCIACLKANIEAITADVLKLYPGAKVLSTADMFSADKRKKTISQIATGDYDIVLMTHDNLNMLPMKPETNAKYINEELAELRAAKTAAESEAEESSSRRKKSGSKSHSVKALEKAEKKLEARLKEALAAEKKDDAVYFEDLGIDHLFVDECQKYKTLPVYTKKDRVKGVPNGRSQRATNMLMRTRWLQEQNGGRGVVFATGTPVSNTMAELYTMQRYLQPQALKERGIDKFDAWANLFGDEQTKMEVNVAGQLKATTRFSRFVNIPELMQIARQVMDIRRSDDIKMGPERVPEEARPKTPEFTGETKDAKGRLYEWENGKTSAIRRPKRIDKIMIAPFTPAVNALMDDLAHRADEIKKKAGPPEKGDDNMLVVCTDGRKGSVDMRLVDPKAKDDPESKTNIAVSNILRIAKERPGKVQLIFSDIGVNPMKMKGGENFEDDDDTDLDEPSDIEGDTDATGMRWYGDVIDKLVAGGIPREKIADFSKLSGEAKEDAQAALRRGDMIIGIGSTQKLGTGVNVQDKITAMHHLDVPWVPADIDQRNARGWRHGNENDTVEVYPYVTEGSLDQMLWQVVSTKDKFIKQVMNPNADAPRSINNDDTEQLTADQIAAAASGDPRWMEKVNLEEEIEGLRRAQVRHDKEQAKLKKAEAATAGRVEAFSKEAEEKAADAKHLQDTPDFRFEIGKIAHTERKDAAEGLKSHLEALEKSTRSSWTEVPVGTYRGMEVFLKGTQGGGRVYLRTPSGKEYETSGSLQGVEAIAQRIEKKYHLEAAKDAVQAQNDLQKIKDGIGKTFARSGDLQAKIDRVKEIEAQLAAESKSDDEKESETPKPATVSMSGAIDVSEDVRAEALRALREMFPLSAYG